jgi:hypothetical protein
LVDVEVVGLDAIDLPAGLEGSVIEASKARRVKPRSEGPFRAISFGVERSKYFPQVYRAA